MSNGIGSVRKGVFDRRDFEGGWRTRLQLINAIVKKGSKLIGRVELPYVTFPLI